MCWQSLKSACFFLVRLITVNVFTVLKNLSSSCIKLLRQRLQIIDPLLKSKLKSGKTIFNTKPDGGLS